MKWMLNRSEEMILLKFMEMTIKTVNSCRARIYALEMLLLKKGYIRSVKELKDFIMEAEKLPTHNENLKILEDMIKEFNKNAKMDSNKS